MKKNGLLVVIALNLLALAALAFVYPQPMLSPGPLLASHTSLNTDCFACHAPGRGIAAQRCIACHALADIGLRTTTGTGIIRARLRPPFHQSLVAQNCSACHSDHAGEKVSQANQKAFSHALLQPVARERCDNCHQGPVDTIHRQISGNCQQCHLSTGWKPASFAHDRFFALDSDHAAACVTCHADNDYKRYTCYGCHEHQPEKMRAKHLREGIRNIDNCVACHHSARKGHGEGRREEHEAEGSHKDRQKD